MYKIPNNLHVYTIFFFSDIPLLWLTWLSSECTVWPLLFLSLYLPNASVIPLLWTFSKQTLPTLQLPLYVLLFFLCLTKSLSKKIKVWTNPLKLKVKSQNLSGPYCIHLQEMKLSDLPKLMHTTTKIQIFCSSPTTRPFICFCCITDWWSKNQIEMLPANSQATCNSQGGK